jgi:hypothetical protein
MLQSSRIYFQQAADVLGLTPKQHGTLFASLRVVRVEMLVEAAMSRNGYSEPSDFVA